MNEIDGNPIVGYSLKKAGVELLFWSGQSFTTQGLKAVGKFAAAGITFKNLDALNSEPLSFWLGESKAIQWNYADLAKNKKLEKLTHF